MPGAPREITPVIDQLNAMLRRLEHAFQRERNLRANVAHELRTPLAGIRSELEVSLSRSRDAEDYRRALGDVLDIENVTAPFWRGDEARTSTGNHSGLGLTIAR